MISYTEACDRAATAQGLAPIIAALHQAEIPAELWQSGGFCMIVVVTSPNDRTEWWITDANEYAPNGDAEPLVTGPHVCRRSDDEYGHCGPCESGGDVMPLEALPAYLSERLFPITRRI